MAYFCNKLIRYVNNIRNYRQSRNVKKREYYKQHYGSNFENQDKMGNSLKKYNLPKLTQKWH